jgi:hypothetical protein
MDFKTSQKLYSVPRMRKYQMEKTDVVLMVD